MATRTRRSKRIIDIGSVESKIPIKLSSELELGKSSWMRKSTVNASLLVKRHAKDSSDIDEPVTKKQVIIEKTPPRSEVDEDLGYSLFEEACPVDRLPPEVLDVVFRYLSPKDRKNVRLVQKAWYERNQNEYAFIEDPVAFKHLENCGLKCWHLRIALFAECWLPRPVWEKIGTNLTSLHFQNCLIGDRLIENVISFCDNLRILHVSLDPHCDSFCSAETLEGLNIVRNKLESLEIIGYPCKNFRSSYDFGKWKRIFEAIFRIFPNLTYFKTGRKCFVFDSEYEVIEEFSCTHGYALKLNETNEFRHLLASNLAYSLSTKAAHWRNAIDTLSTVRLKELSIKFVKDLYTTEDKNVLLNLLANQKELKHLEIKFGKQVDANNLKSILLRVCDNCCSLSKLKLIASNLHFYWLHHLSAAESCQLQSKILKLERLHFDNFIMENSSLCTKLRVLKPSNYFQFDQSFKCLIQRSTHLQHLTLTHNVSDECLQSVFQYLTGLETLKIKLCPLNTNFGMIGRRKKITENSFGGYSISRLQNLKSLEIEWCNRCEVDDDIFYDFVFPKLRYLSSLPPKDHSIFVFMADKMPDLREINFSSGGFHAKAALDLCLVTKNLRTLNVLPEKFHLTTVKKMFKACPSLRVLHTLCGTYYWEPFTERLISNKKQDETSEYYELKISIN